MCTKVSKLLIIICNKSDTREEKTSSDYERSLILYEKGMIIKTYFIDLVSRYILHRYFIPRCHGVNYLCIFIFLYFIIDISLLCTIIGTFVFDTLIIRYSAIWLIDTLLFGNLILCTLILWFLELYILVLRHFLTWYFGISKYRYFCSYLLIFQWYLGDFILDILVF